MRNILIVFAIFYIVKVNAQDTALDKVSSEICEYLQANEDEINKMSYDDKIASFGVKMVEVYVANKKALEKEGIKFDLSKGASEGEKLGELIGLNMVKYCPKFILALGEEHNERNASSENIEVSESVKGKIKKISGEDLYILEIKDTEGKTQKFVWLNNFEGSDKLIDLEGEIKGVEVELFYENIELFSPKLKEYIVRKKITKLNFLE